MSVPIFGTIKADETGVVEDWHPTVNLRVFVTYGRADFETTRVLQQLWYDTKSDKQEWRDVPEVIG